jgi:hypothetical protein
MINPGINEFRDLARAKDMKAQKEKRDELLRVATQLTAGLLTCSAIELDEESLSDFAVSQAKSLVKKVDAEFDE